MQIGVDPINKDVGEGRAPLSKKGFSTDGESKSPYIYNDFYLAENGVNEFKSNEPYIGEGSTLEEAKANAYAKAESGLESAIRKEIDRVNVIMGDKPPLSAERCSIEKEAKRDLQAVVEG